ncbi:hypothetical protein S1361_06600 [Streptomyces cyanogenus]|uniref:Uncharacterized protein n=1 Tax=Streptomyces cyanogenus TaxID=80860 RepID=A0ABX7TK07_STRCY|nr:hypothetical protein S1361_06600 [Streptomyces cyanogenus]
MSQTSRQNPDGTWSPAQPLPLTRDFDAEVYGTGPWTWIAYRAGVEAASGRARTKFGLRVALLRARVRTARPAQPAV